MRGSPGCSIFHPEPVADPLNWGRSGRRRKEQLRHTHLRGGGRGGQAEEMTFRGSGSDSLFPLNLRGAVASGVGAPMSHGRVVRQCSAFRDIRWRERQPEPTGIGPREQGLEGTSVVVCTAADCDKFRPPSHPAPNQQQQPGQPRAKGRAGPATVNTAIRQRTAGQEQCTQSALWKYSEGQRNGPAVRCATHRAPPFTWSGGAAWAQLNLSRIQPEVIRTTLLEGSPYLAHGLSPASAGAVSKAERYGHSTGGLEAEREREKSCPLSAPQKAHARVREPLCDRRVRVRPPSQPARVRADRTGTPAKDGPRMVSQLSSA